MKWLLERRRSRLLPQINGKSILACTECDLSVLIDNESYRENEYLDYKRTFAFLEVNKGNERNAKKAEFRSDVCSFANADGGYLIFGISDKNGCAASIDGIEILNNDTDRFELDRRNDLNGIQPKVPPLQFSFIKLKSGKYVVILFVRHDRFAPYIHVEEEKNYKIYRRYGNGKRVIPYTELRQMFNQSFTLEQSISDYTHKRIEYYRSIGKAFGEKFVHIMLIPETYMDYSYRHNIFVLERSENVNFGSMFSSFGCNTPSIPCVDGIRFIPYYDTKYCSEAYVRNNGVVEACMALDDEVQRDGSRYPDGFLAWEWLWNKIREICYLYTKVFNDINTGERVYICLSLVGCRNVETEDKEFIMDYTGKIDRDEIICEPVELIKIDDSDEFEILMKKMYISFLLAIGVKHDKKLSELIDEVYGSVNS